MNTKEITVTVAGQERRFNLHPFTIRQALDHIEASEVAWNAARAVTKEAIGDPMHVTLSSRAYLEAVQPTVLSLLAQPADGGAALTEEEFWALDAREPAAVLAAQEDFAQLRSIVANGQLLIEESQREVIADAVKASQALAEQIEQMGA